MKQIIHTLQIALLCMLMPIVARQSVSSDTKDGSRKQRAVSAIFSDIMQTLPPGMKAKVDSASTNRKNVRPAPSAQGPEPSGSRSSSEAAASRRDGAIHNLPDDVRGQVEKAIVDIDLMNQNRQIQFKEYEKKHPGPR
jgi:hypothetical protein